MATITLSNVSKRYVFTEPLEVRRLLGRWLGLGASRDGRQAQQRARGYALQNLSLTLERGESIGVIGRNGAGKTTLLRLLAGVTLPTEGHVRIEGTVAALIGLGIGFHPDLTGRENAYLYAALMGYRGREARDRVGAILDFAEVGNYADVAFKRYSSGMMARLGFSAAVAVEPDILLLDEVLAVGDHAFYMKSHAALASLASRCTVVLVSHNLEAIPQFCRRAIWIEGGRMVQDGPADAVVASYLQAQPAPPA
jgi:ABC-type polysaccharide/polyol phosphate transport system ATPase subunit